MDTPESIKTPAPTPQADPTPDPLSNNYSALELTSLQDLAIRGSWRSILDKVSRARTQSLLNTPHDHLTYLAYNVLALSKLRHFKDALTELETVDDFDSHHYRYETYPKIYLDRSGSMVPFVLRWLYAVIPIKLGNRKEGLDRFYELLGFVRRKVSEKKEEGSVSVWKRREVFVINGLISHHLSNKEFGLCLDLIEELIFGGYLDPVLLSKLGYIQMQIGDLEGAKGSFDKVEKILDERGTKGGDEDSLSEVEFRNIVSRNKALMYLVGKDYVSAVREYEACIERDPMDVVAINNKALCLMYLRDLSDSIKVLENSLERVPTVALNETLVVNLCSMYELAYVNHSDIKRTLSNWIARVAPDDFDSSCTRT